MNAPFPSSSSGLSSSFRICAGELGMWSASRIFVNTVFGAGGTAALGALDDDLAAEFPVVDAAVRRVQASARPIPPPSIEQVAEACAGLRRLLVVGVEAAVLSPLIAVLSADVEVFALFDGMFPVDEARLRASWTPRVQLVELGSFQRAAGSRSGLLTALYGADEFRAVVIPSWLRVHGPDVRLLFRRLIGVNLLGPRMAGFPRWLAETASADFTDVVDAS